MDTKHINIKVGNYGRIFTGFALVVGLFLFVVPLVSNAQGGFVTCDGNTTPCTSQHLAGMAIRIINYLLGLAAAVALAMLVFGGIKMLLSAGQPDRIKDGKSTVFNALLGLTLTFTVWIIINSLLVVFTGGSIADVVNFWN